MLPGGLGMMRSYQTSTNLANFLIDSTIDDEDQIKLLLLPFLCVLFNSMATLQVSHTVMNYDYDDQVKTKP